MRVLGREKSVKPFKHARCSAKTFKGKPEDYLHIHEWLDQSKTHVADVRHRFLLHSSTGIYLCAQALGDQFINSDGREVSVRDVAEQHILEDLGFIPSLDRWLRNVKIEPWMGGNVPKRKYLEMKGKVLNEALRKGVTTTEEAMDYIKAANALVQFTQDGLNLTVAASKQLVTVTALTEVDAVNKVIERLKKYD